MPEITSMKAPSCGWIGLGKMGVPMATNLLRAGLPLAVFNRSQAALDGLLAEEAVRCGTVSELAASRDVIFSMVSDDTALRAVALGPLGVIENAPVGAVFIDMSTVSPTISEEISKAATERGVHYLRAPVSGSVATAAAGALTILISGPQKAFEECQGIFNLLGKKMYYLGEGEQARFLKIAINLSVGVTAAMMGEAFALAERGGVEWPQILEVFNSSVVASPLLGYKAEMLRERKFAPMFSATQMAKDFDLALEAGRNGNVPLPLAAISRQFYGALISSGKGDQDFFAYVTLIEKLAGLDVSEIQIKE